MDPLSWSIIVFFILTFLLVVFVVFKMRRRSGFDAKSIQYIKSHWIRILDMFPGNPRGSVLDADKLLDYCLGKHGFQGNLGEKLKKAGPRFSDVNGVWRAHKLRNRIAHELNDIDVYDAKSAIKHFKQAMNDLGAQL